MCREKEITIAALQYVKKETSRVDYPKWTDVEMAFQRGMKYADQHPVYFKGQTDKMQEREVAFVDYWMKEHKEQPTYADAIAWAEKRVIEKASEWLFDNTDSYMVVAGTGHWINNMGLIKDFKKAMEE